MKKKIKTKPTRATSRLKIVFWFVTGFALGAFFLFSFIYIGFEQGFKERVYPGVSVAGVAFSGKTKQEVREFFDKKNSDFENVKFKFTSDSESLAITARELKYGFNSELLAQQAITIGRADNRISNLYIKIQGLVAGVELSPSYSFSEDALLQKLGPLLGKINIEPIDALFNFRDGRVIVFRPSNDGQEVDLTALKKELASKAPEIIGTTQKEKIITIKLPILVKKAKIQTTDSNKFGIKELIGFGSSKFVGSIPNRLYNIQLAASRINGILVPPGDTFSFNSALGDVSKFTGYKEAFVISGGKTILGDGGGVCQVSTTLFRAILNSGMPITQRHAHSYRVGYYEQDSSPGFDATVFSPSVDLKFKNDTPNYILIQAYTDSLNKTLTFSLYGTSDNRETVVGKPVITNQTPAPPPLYQDDPNLPRGTEKQIDFAATGANVYFTRTVEKDGQVIISDKFISNFRPWQAVYLRGTKE